MNRVHPRRSSNRAQRGAYAVEFALVFLLFFSVLYGIIGYGMLLTFRMGLQSAAEDGARAALRYKPTPQERADVASDVAKQLTLRWMPSILEPFLTVTPSCSVAGAAAGSCGACAPNPAWEQRCQIIVTVKVQRMDLLLPPMLSFALPSQITGQASMLLEASTS